MDLDRAREFLRTHHRAALATPRSDGRPQMSPVLSALDADGRVLVSTREPAIKTRNLRRDPRASVCVLSDSFFGDWVQVDGDAEIVSLPDAMPILIEYYRQLSGEHPDWQEYQAAMVRDRRCIIRITLRRAGPDISG
ncbi:MAG TPA: PPOX class F420-dependent oxidoreductase [Streptosporangiaceae bacterium]|nr:PPOX class F420-dependent oxidoreductase [Streptosporangiaceae bacterium]